MKIPVIKPWLLILAGLAVIVVIVTSVTSVFTVKESEKGILTTFGRYTRTVDAGLHVKLPYPIQSVTILPVNLTQKIELGYGTKTDGTYFSIPEESNMITGDMNIVNIDFFVEWKISDPVKFLFETENPNLILKNMIQSSVRSVVGTKSIDDVLTAGKIQIQADVKEQLRQRFDQNDIGLMVLDVKVNDSEPPTESVSKAFRDVETAKQEKETALNQAFEYRNSKLPAAKASADKIMKDAEGQKQARINEAVGERDRFLSMYNQYVTFPQITRTRMYLEAMESILPNVKVYIDGGGSTQTLLPLESFTGTGTQTTQSTQSTVKG